MKPSLGEFMMKILLLLALLTGSEGSSVVVGLPGGGVTLPCTYDIGSYGPLPVCWSRGSLPTFGCGDKLVSSDGREAAEPSDRHRLLGRLEDGDVSMTILNVSRADAGRYGCRVDIPGWFNDDKHHFDMVVEEASQTTTSMTSTGETTTTDQGTRGHVTSALRLPTSSSGGILAEGSSSVSVVLVCVLLGLASLVVAAVLVIALRRLRHGKTSGPLVSVEYREAAVENVYQMEAEGETLRFDILR